MGKCLAHCMDCLLMDMELFRCWFKSHFLRYAPASRPLLLLMDGHSSHVCPEIIRTAAAEGIILFTLPPTPNTTHLSQGYVRSPEDSMEEVHKFTSNNCGREVTRYDFSVVFSDALSKAMTVKNIASGFKVTGVFPFNSHAIHLAEEEFTKFN